MKTFGKYLSEQKQTFIIHGQAGSKPVTHEVEAKSHEHAKTLFKKAMKEKGHKYTSTTSIRTKDEEESHKAKSAAFTKEREEKLKKGAAEREKEKEYWDSRQKEYDKQSYKGE